MVTNPPSNARDMGLIPDQGMKILHAMGQLSPCTTTREAHLLQLESCVSAAGTEDSVGILLTALQSFTLKTVSVMC